MHGGTPKLLIIAKRELAGDLIPDFSGPGYVEAKKKMVSGESANGNGQLTGESGIGDKLRALAEEVDELTSEGPSDDDGGEAHMEGCPPGDHENKGVARELE